MLARSTRVAGILFLAPTSSAIKYVLKSHVASSHYGHTRSGLCKLGIDIGTKQQPRALQSEVSPLGVPSSEPSMSAGSGLFPVRQRCTEPANHSKHH